MRACEFLEAFAGGYQRLRDEGIESLLVEAHARFIAPALFDDRLLVHARCLDVRGARFRFEYAVERGGERDRGRLDGPRDGRRGDAEADPDAAVAGSGYCSTRPGRAGVVVVAAGGAGVSFGFGFGVSFGPTSTIVGSER